MLWDAAGIPEVGANSTGGSDQEPVPESGRQVYERVAKTLGLDLYGAESACHTVKEFSMAGLRGDYRRLIIRPRRLRHVFVQHTDMHEDIISEGLVVENAGQSKRQKTAKESNREAKDGQPVVGIDETVHGTESSVGACEDKPRPGLATSASHEHEVGDMKEARVASLSEPPIDTPDACKELLEDAYGSEDGATIVMRAQPQPQAATHACDGEQRAGGEAVAGKDGEGKGGGMASLVLTFALPSSCYATMLLRELLKGSTATSAHKQAFADAGGVVGGPTSADGEEAGGGL